MPPLASKSALTAVCTGAGIWSSRRSSAGRGVVSITSTLNVGEPGAEFVGDCARAADGWRHDAVSITAAMPLVTTARLSPTHDGCLSTLDLFPLILFCDR